MAETIEVKVNEIIKFLNLLSADEQDRILKKIKKSLSSNKQKKERKEKKLLVPSPEISPLELLGEYKNGIPELENKEELEKKYSMKLEQLEPIKDLFKDEPSAEELIKML